MQIRMGIDTGGTFTDLVAYDADSGSLTFHKVSSTPADPSEAIIAGAGELAANVDDAARDRAGLDDESLKAVTLLVHGTTVATNAVLERRGAKASLVTTAGFRDILHIQRQNRPELYNLRARRPQPLIPRRLRFELNERMLHDGSVRQPIDHDELKALAATLAAADVESVAVAFLHSYANPAHELEVGRLLAEQLPGVTISLSHALVGEHGEYERFSTCAMNAYVQPVMKRYLAKLEDRMTQAKMVAPLFVMKSNGGMMSADTAGRQCIETILSGPAGGVVAGAAMANHHHNANLITADMGGTSFDVSVIHQGKPAYSRESTMGGLAIGATLLDIHTVGAGGGSIGWIDAGGSLRVGPESAGAQPGPACYGRGGDRPTVTDANVVLGRLAPASLLGGHMQLDVDAARRAVQDHIASPLKLTVEQAAEGMIRVVNATMTAAIRKLTVERGHDPRTFVLCPFGGAGPLHASELAFEMGVSEILVPIAPGVTSAVGLLMSNLREDRVRTWIVPLNDADDAEITNVFQSLEHDAAAPLQQFAGSTLTVTRRMGLRYRGQRYDLPVILPAGPIDRSALVAAFHGAHQQAFGFAREDETVELANCWVAVEADLHRLKLPESKVTAGTPEPAATRRVTFAGADIETPIYRRDDLPVDWTTTGPAIIEQLDSTTVLWPGQSLCVDQYGQLILGPIPREGGKSTP